MYGSQSGEFTLRSWEQKELMAQGLASGDVLFP